MEPELRRALELIKDLAGELWLAYELDGPDLHGDHEDEDNRKHFAKAYEKDDDLDPADAIKRAEEFYKRVGGEDLWTGEPTE